MCCFINHKPYDLESIYRNLRRSKGNFTKCLKVFSTLTFIILIVFFPTWCKLCIIPEKCKYSYYTFVQERFCDSNSSLCSVYYSITHRCWHAILLTILSTSFFFVTHMYFAKSIVNEYFFFQQRTGISRWRLPG